MSRFEVVTPHFEHIGRVLAEREKMRVEGIVPVYKVAINISKSIYPDEKKLVVNERNPSQCGFNRGAI